jgi:hypothetical protein
VITWKTGIDWRIILKLILKKQGERFWARSEYGSTVALMYIAMDLRMTCKEGEFLD